jgi:hypothetical protein
MADWNVSEMPDPNGQHSVPWTDGPDPANDSVLVMSDGTLPTANDDVPLGFLIDEKPSEEAPHMGDVHGEGAVVEDQGANLTVDDPVYSDGAGGVTQTKPGSAGDDIVRVGVAITSTDIMVDIDLTQN